MFQLSLYVRIMGKVRAYPNTGHTSKMGGGEQDYLVSHRHAHSTAKAHHWK
jgi:hypothetical protein